MDVIHHGAFEGVTGSCHELLLDSDHSLLIDCGLFQGAETSGSGADSNTQEIDFDISKVQALVVTHCHIDHVGRIPRLLIAGFTGPIYCTKATAHLLPLVIEDALKVGLTSNADIINAVVARLQRQLQPVEYDAWSELPTDFSTERFKLRFRQAGHILGSSYVELENVSNHYRVVFSGDLGCKNTPLLPDPTPLERADWLFLESTYGDKNHESRLDREQRLKSVVERCVENKGTILIPAFSIGRTQELLYELEDIIHRAREEETKTGVADPVWHKMTVILDSPLAAQFTKQYRAMKALWDDEALARVEEDRHPLNFDRLMTVDGHSEHERVVNYLKSSGDPCIVIAASGMCTGGRMLNYLRALLPDPRTDVLFVGYQAAGTPGRDIQTYGPRGGYVDLDHERVYIKAGIYTLGGYSAHADQQELLDFIDATEEPVKRIRLIHGEPDARAALAEKIRDRYGVVVD
ncbi:MBL fold metallo-hydrolase RNA specificity domain-containing protein [Idiomarina piscisalsi]|uniref:MBL fold metallo-hydrolase RNA specificity domain-containing protein n=1 Tax=Idiomarina piscisalsi TaxID=1096243 RepID=UPI0013821F86|nr:MBL fold metallo-hydrolase [Idiomarina piscisalsi]MTJ02260.1 MBL fold metallo-hydrolase [Idiomarina piscisalsi]